MFKSPTQPYCRVCGNAIAKHVRTVWVEKPGAVALALNKPTDWSRHVAGPLATKADCQRHSNGWVVSVRRAGDTVRQFGEWDGESYKDEFFCNGSCARAFAYMAARHYPTLVSKQYNEKARARDAGKG